MKLALLRDGMADSLDANPYDEILQPLLSELDQVRAQNHLSFLIQNRAVPIIKGILKQKLSAWGKLDCFDDLQNEVVLKLVSRLRQFVQAPDEYSIWNFRDYVVATTGRVCNTYLRSRSPNRSRLRNSVMYLLTRDSAFFVTEVHGEKICGLSEWLQTVRAIDLRKGKGVENPENIRAKIKTGTQDASSFRAALKELFRISGGPLDPDEVMKVMSVVFNVEDGIYEGKSQDAPDIFDHLPDQRIDAQSAMETMQDLKKMWSEIQKLPVNQRSALLLNLKDADGNDLLSNFPLQGIATFREIASTLQISMDEFTEIWKEIPLGDLKIAELLGITRQQVINLRKSARERLMRRL